MVNSERTQIKFSNPDIDGAPSPQLISLEQEDPIEGKTTKDNGEEIIWHKWLCTDNKYFMASDSLDGMLKMTPDKVGRVIKIQKVENPKGGFPFFEVDNKNKDQIVSDIKAENKKPYQTKDIETEMPSQTVQPIDGALKLITQKLDQIVSMLNKMQPAEKPQEKPQGLPF